MKVVKFVQIAASQTASASNAREVLDVLYALDTDGRCWRNVGGLDWEPLDPPQIYSQEEIEKKKNMEKEQHSGVSSQ